MLAKLAGVASEAEVSRSTVSRVIRNTDYIVAPTRRKVLDTIQKLGYQSSSVARHLKYMRTYTQVHSTKVMHVKDWMALRAHWSRFVLILTKTSWQPVIGLLKEDTEQSVNGFYYSSENHAVVLIDWCNRVNKRYLYYTEADRR